MRNRRCLITFEEEAAWRPDMGGPCVRVVAFCGSYCGDAFMSPHAAKDDRVAAIAWGDAAKIAVQAMLMGQGREPK